MARLSGAGGCECGTADALLVGFRRAGERSSSFARRSPQVGPARRPHLTSRMRPALLDLRGRPSSGSGYIRRQSGLDIRSSVQAAFLYFEFNLILG